MNRKERREAAREDRRAAALDKWGLPFTLPDKNGKGEYAAYFTRKRAKKRR